MLTKLAAALSLLVTLSMASAPVSALTVSAVGHWGMNENPVGPSTSILDTIGANNGYTYANSTVSSVAPISPNSTGAFYFPGWTQLQTGGTVDPTASLFDIPDTADSRYNPGTSNFSVSIWANTLNPAALVNNGTILSDDTLNIVQKGLSGQDPVTKLQRQQWKISVNPLGKFICSFRGPNASGVVTDYEIRSKALAFGVTHELVCSLSAGVVTLQVLTPGSATLTYTGQGPLSVSSTADISVGKKPGTNYPGDTFAGTLDDLTISKGN